MSNKSHNKNSRSFNSPSINEPEPKTQPFKLSPFQVQAVKEEFNKSNEKYLKKTMNSQKNAIDTSAYTNKSATVNNSGTNGAMP
jgi:hypothetical protein